MTYCAYVTRVTNIQKVEGADRLNQGLCFGNPIVFGKEVNELSLYIYFPIDGQLSVEYAEANNLLRKKDEFGKSVGGYLDPVKRNIRAIKLRGVKSDGFIMPLSSLESFGDITKLKNGDTIDIFNKHLICSKYIPVLKQSGLSQGPKAKKIKVIDCQFFKEHVDTSQLVYNLNAFRCGDLLEITLKMHGTSQRTGFLPVTRYKKNFLHKLFKKVGKPYTEYDYISGTRRTILTANKSDGWYEDNEFRKIQAQKLEGKLHQGETVYYEVVGYVNNETTIMGTADNNKLKDKDFLVKYGSNTVFSYGCEVGESEMYVYRMNLTTPDGHVVEYSYDLMKNRCEQMGVNVVPLFETFLYTDEKDLLTRVDAYKDGIDPIGKTHIREGVVVRVVNRPTFCAFKDKNFSFKVLEGIIKDVAEAPDMEEIQEV